MNYRRTRIIGCETVIEELQHLLPSDTEPLTLEAGLHLNPDKLRKALQEKIDEITIHTEIVILAYGLCSRGVIGLKASHSTLVVPRRDDCVAMFLGSQEAYKTELKKEPGTYFLSKGWIDAGITLLDELEMMEDRYGKSLAERLMKRMLQNYKRLVFIDMGYQNRENYLRYCQKVASKFDLRYDEVNGTLEFLRKICNGPWDDEFVVAVPGHTICFEDFEKPLVVKSDRATI